MGQNKTDTTIPSSDKPTFKVGKYFTYAIGEIILVMIGILLALQVNNWNENRIAEANTKVYIDNMIYDVIMDNVMFSYQANAATLKYTYNKEIHAIIVQNNSILDT